MVLTISALFLSDGKNESPCVFENGLYEQIKKQGGSGSMVTHKVSALLTPEIGNEQAAAMLTRFGCRIVLENGQKFKIAASETTAETSDEGVALNAEWSSFGASFTL